MCHKRSQSQERTRCTHESVDAKLSWHASWGSYRGPLMQLGPFWGKTSAATLPTTMYRHRYLIIYANKQTNCTTKLALHSLLVVSSLISYRD